MLSFAVMRLPWGLLVVMSSWIYGSNLRVFHSVLFKQRTFAFKPRLVAQVNTETCRLAMRHIVMSGLSGIHTQQVHLEKPETFSVTGVKGLLCDECDAAEECIGVFKPPEEKAWPCENTHCTTISSSDRVPVISCVPKYLRSFLFQLHIPSSSCLRVHLSFLTCGKLNFYFVRHFSVATTFYSVSPT